ncbi:hypothetical protein EXN66_Car022409 [Channa argus]|uniref:Uncharacterized protein n=1 Tax=Channa argus TaxID=215402 RepID=A0A6G1QW52_CHAAH|nr:hypothetical protein EXN66_Car022409 [Channa argus]
MDTLRESPILPGIEGNLRSETVVVWSLKDVIVYYIQGKLFLAKYCVVNVYSSSFTDIGVIRNALHSGSKLSVHHAGNGILNSNGVTLVHKNTNLHAVILEVQAEQMTAQAKQETLWQSNVGVCPPSVQISLIKSNKQPTACPLSALSLSLLLSWGSDYMKPNLVENDIRECKTMIDVDNERCTKHHAIGISFCPRFIDLVLNATNIDRLQSGRVQIQNKCHDSIAAVKDIQHAAKTIDIQYLLKLCHRALCELTPAPPDTDKSSANALQLVSTPLMACDGYGQELKSPSSQCKIDADVSGQENYTVMYRPSDTAPIAFHLAMMKRWALPPLSSPHARRLITHFLAVVLVTEVMLCIVPYGKVTRHCTVATDTVTEWMYIKYAKKCGNNDTKGTAEAVSSVYFGATSLKDTDKRGDWICIGDLKYACIMLDVASGADMLLLSQSVVNSPRAKCQEAALLAPRRKRCSLQNGTAASPYHCAPVPLLRDPEARMWGEEEEIPYGFPLRDLFLIEGLQLVRMVLPHSQGFAFLGFA